MFAVFKADFYSVVTVGRSTFCVRFFFEMCVLSTSTKMRCYLLESWLFKRKVRYFALNGNPRLEIQVHFYRELHTKLCCLMSNDSKEMFETNAIYSMVLHDAALVRCLSCQKRRLYLKTISSTELQTEIVSTFHVFFKTANFWRNFAKDRWFCLLGEITSFKSLFCTVMTDFFNKIFHCNNFCRLVGINCSSWKSYHSEEHFLVYYHTYM